MADDKQPDQRDAPLAVGRPGLGSVQAGNVKPAASKPPVQPTSSAPVRAIGEDDDGYDPYTDWHDQQARRPEPLFERDPWD